MAFVAQALTGWAVYKVDLTEHGRTVTSLTSYLVSGHFWSTTLENWESEFLQMGMFLVLTVFLRQAGSAESRPFEREHPKIAPGATPGMARGHGFKRWLYEHSLSMTYLALFSLSLGGHLVASWKQGILESHLRGSPPPSFFEYAQGAQFWFESFQNWQSEFLAFFTLVVLTIWLREKDSPQSKAVEAPHSQTGD